MSHITNEKWALLREKMSMLGIEEHDIQESFIQGGGSGGQKINKTSSTVVLKYKEHHVRCKKSRSRDGNRFLHGGNCVKLLHKNLVFQLVIKRKLIKQWKQKQRRKRRAKQKYSSNDD